MIYSLNMSCERDKQLSELMRQTLNKYCPAPHKGYIQYTDDFDIEYGNGAGWIATMAKLDIIRSITDGIKKNDWFLSVDSDMVFTSPEVFDYLNPKYGIIGIKHDPLFTTALGQWSHMSGALIFIRGDIARKICALRKEELNEIRANDFKGFDLTENEDVVLSYLASYVGAEQFALPGHLSSGDFEGDVIKYRSADYIQNVLTGVTMKSFYHLNYCPTSFMGEPISGKWDIAKVLKMKGIEL